MLTDRRYQEILGILLILFSIILLLSLFSFSINDFELLTHNKPVYNIIGPIGSYFSNFLRGAFGYSSFFLVLVFAISGWSILRKGKLTDVMERIFSLLYLMISSSMLTSLLSNASIPHFAGGYIGLYLLRFFESLFNNTGAYIIVAFLNLIGLILIGIISMSSMLEYTENKGGKFYSLLKTILKNIFLYNFRNRKKIPLNNIENEIIRRYKKIPWITKKRIKIFDDNDGNIDANPTKSESPKLLEMKDPVPLELDSLIKEKLVSSDFFNDVNTEFHPEPFSFVEESTEGTNIDDVSNTGSLDLIKYPNPYYEDETAQESGNEEEIDASYLDSNESTLSAFEGIETYRIKSVEPEICISPAILIEEKDELNTFEPDPVDEETETGVVELNELEEDIDTPYKHYFTRVFKNIEINGDYIIPTSFLRTSVPVDIESWKIEVKKNSELLVNTLLEFGIESRVINVQRGPVITLYEMRIAPGIKINRIVGLSDDIAMALAAYRVRIVAPIPGKSAIGVEIPNREREMVTMGDILNQPEYKSAHGKLKIVLGKDILGKPIMLDLKKLPHLLIAGATGSGKSVCVNSIITGLIYNYNPNHVRFILIDPKLVELQLYNGLPHLLAPVITDPNIAPKALKWAMYEMERRYQLLSELNTRDIDKYNYKIKGYEQQYERLPYIVIIMDELADLMMIAAKEIEGSIIRIAQKARAVGIHLVLATQRPSVDIITGIIKANFPARIAFQVAQKTDSRTIIDQNGAEKLLGKGDMLYQSPTSSFPIRIQGTFISEDEIMELVRHLKKMGKPSYVDVEESIFDEDNTGNDESVEDELFIEAIRIIEETKKASASYLQRRLSIGYNRAARIIEMMEDRGYVGPQQGSKPREVYV